MSIRIQFKEITAANWQDAYHLKVKPEQNHLIASNAFSLVQVRYDLAYQNKAFGIYD